MDNALAIITRERAAGALIFSPQNIDTPPLYKVEATVIKARPDEFHNMKGKFMPNRAVTDRISEAAGVDFIAAECSVVAETREAMPELGLPRRTVFVGYAQGRTRLPDGSWRNSTKADYEFDPVLRAKSEGKGDREALEYMKFARQRASTGARLGVIRQLVGIPVTFSEREITLPLVFSRVVQNTDYILGTKEGRIMAIAAATGIAAQMYGPQGVPEISQEEPLRDASDGEARVVSDDWDEPAQDSPSVRISQIMLALEEWAASDTIVASRAKAIIERKESSLPVLEASLAIIKYLGDGNERGGKACLAALDGPGKADMVVLEDILGKIKAAAA